MAGGSRGERAARQSQSKSRRTREGGNPTVSIAIVSMSDAPKALLTGRVPYLREKEGKKGE